MPITFLSQLLPTNALAVDTARDEIDRATRRSKPSNRGNLKDDNRGLGYQLYDNAVLAGSPPSYEGTTLSASLSLKPPSGEPNTTATTILSGSLKGSLSVAEIAATNLPFSKERQIQDKSKSPIESDGNPPPTPLESDDWYVFECAFAGTSHGWVRVGGHLVCHDGSAYRHQQPEPIPLAPGRVYAFHAILASNTTSVTIGTKPQNDDRNEPIIPSVSVYWKKWDPRMANGESDRHPLDRGFRLLSASPPKAISSEDPFVLHPALPPHEAQRQALQDKVSRGWGHWLLPDLLGLTKLPEGIVVGLQICGPATQPGRTTNTSSSSTTAATTTTTKLDGGSLSGRICVDPVVPDSQGAVRVDSHATDRSYSSMNLTFVIPSQDTDDADRNTSTNNHASSDEQRMTLTIETSVSGPDREILRSLITVVECDPSCDGYAFVPAPRYAWFRPGDVHKTSDFSYAFLTPGMEDIGVHLVADGGDFANGDESLSTPLIWIPITRKGDTVGVYAGPGWFHHENLPDLTKHIRAAERKYESEMEQTFGPKKEVAKAIAATVMWSWIYNPIEGGPLLPVSRSPSWAETFANKAGATNPEWTYVVFEWDNLFASLLAGLFDKDIAYSNLIASVRSKTPSGFLPNWSTAGGIQRSGDRTEPPVGAKVLLELYKKHKDKWIVEALWDDLVEGNDWFLKERLLEPLGLIGLGSYEDNHASDHFDIQNNLKAARYESGLDNSPMYDGDEDLLYDNTTHRMQMYDVGMSALVANEAYCLAELADLVGMYPDKARLLRSRGDSLRDNIWKHLWDPTRNIFANRYRKFLPGTNSSFVRSITPTSFYPLLLPVPGGKISFASEKTSSGDDAIYLDVATAVDLMAGSWLLNSTRFCLSPNGDFEGNDPNACYWGLPSVSADDPAYMAVGQWNYWRGRVWGPMAQIVYWSLQERDEISSLSSSSSLMASASLLQQNINDLLRNENLLRANQRKTRSKSSSSSSLPSNITKARKSLCSQMEALMMSQWEENRHICENYSPFKNATECSGTLFYHWGALNGIIGMIDDGYYY